MNIRHLKLVAIGNSRGIRLPKPLLRKYGLENEIVLEETPEGLLLRRPESTGKLGLEETFAEMALADEHWDDLEVAVGDGLD